MENEQNDLDDFDFSSDSDSDSEYYSDYDDDVKSLYGEQIPNPWFNYLYDSIKTWNIGLKINNWNDIKLNHFVLYSGEINGRNKVCCAKVIDIREYKNFTEVFKEIPIQKSFPDISSENDAIKLLRSWYNEINEIKYGVIAVNFERIY